MTVNNLIQNLSEMEAEQFVAECLKHVGGKGSTIQSIAKAVAEQCRIELMFDESEETYRLELEWQEDRLNEIIGGA